MERANTTTLAPQAGAADDAIPAAPASPTISTSTVGLDAIINQTEQASQRSTGPESGTAYAYNLIGEIVRCTSAYRALVRFRLQQQSYEYNAETVLVLQQRYEGQRCLLTFNEGDLAQPVIIGMVQNAMTDPANAPLELGSDQGVRLQCGDSRIELDANGTVNIQALHINSQAYGPHRIKGGSVKIN